jgi:uncharacterized membrane protein YadS
MLQAYGSNRVKGICAMNPKIIFFVGLILTASGIVSPPIALLAGIAYGFTFTHPYHLDSRNLSRFLLQAAVVALGFGMNLLQVVHAGRAGFLYTAISISAAMLLGWLLGRTLGVSKNASFLITAGTAICGGSAIAAIAPITKPDEEKNGDVSGHNIHTQFGGTIAFSGYRSRLHMSQTSSDYGPL